MLRLPGRVVVQLRDPSGRLLDTPDVLIAINVLHEGRYYYGNLVGLTDPRGQAQVTRDELERRFRADQATYPMDYRIALEDGDPIVEVAVLSEQELSAARVAVASSPVASPELRACYHRARNASFTPGMLRFWADLPGVTAAEVALTTVHEHPGSRKS